MLEGFQQAGEGGAGGGGDVGADGGEGGDQGGDLAGGEVDRGDGGGDVEAEAAAGAAAGGDGDAGVAEAGDVAFDGSDVDSEGGGQVLGGGVPAGGQTQLLDQAVLALDPEPGQVGWVGATVRAATMGCAPFWRDRRRRAGLSS